jgi:hypothetical protein
MIDHARSVLAVATIALGACDVGSVLGDGGGGSGNCVPAATPGGPHTHLVGGTSNAGQACTAAACHLPGNTGTNATAYSFAGTLYTSAAATTTVSGATVKVTASGATLAAVSDADGNFYSAGNALTFPASTLATKCPSANMMLSQLATGGGNCNNCHQPGGATSPIFVQ